jgi:hypothetical protein
MKISVQSQPSYKRIPVSVSFKLINGESYKELYMRKCNFAARINAGRIKEFHPQWYKDAMTLKRNQRAA